MEILWKVNTRFLNQNVLYLKFFWKQIEQFYNLFKKYNFMFCFFLNSPILQKGFVCDNIAWFGGDSFSLKIIQSVCTNHPCHFLLENTPQKQQ